MNNGLPLEELRTQVEQTDPIKDKIFNYLQNYTKILGKTDTDAKIQADANEYLGDPSEEKLENIEEKITKALNMIGIKMIGIKKNLFNAMIMDGDNMQGFGNVDKNSVIMDDNIVQTATGNEDNVAGKTTFNHYQKPKGRKEKEEGKSVTMKGTNNQRNIREAGDLRVDIMGSNNELTIELLTGTLSGTLMGSNNSIVIEIVGKNAEIDIDQLGMNNEIEIEIDLRKPRKSSKKATGYQQPRKQTVHMGSGRQTYNFTTDMTPEGPIGEKINSKEVKGLGTVSTHKDAQGIRVIFQDSDFLINKDKLIGGKFMNNMINQGMNNSKIQYENGRVEFYSTEKYVRIKYRGERFFIDRTTGEITDHEPE